MDAAPPAIAESPGSPGLNANGKRAAPSSSESAHDFEPPQTSIRKILKASLPEHATIGKEANLVFTRAAGIFVMYMTACANDLARDNGRSSIAASDILNAVKELELAEIFDGKLEEFLKEFRADEEKKKAEKTKQKAAAVAAASVTGGAVEDGGASKPAAAGVAAVEVAPHQPHTTEPTEPTAATPAVPMDTSNQAA
ncbi:hypothetical protein TrRE_jg13272 [Triparma retinervis]|uniref:Transcription factor CBF/NF-Y/archaeal histone domain-containing protein n=1 Tax=Triparma retinervis TaxID=2557542 RepID=A0A9W7C7G1_9STRA|nr:hypothetical protein TrRE_jg13272 [Triparma retinervis]